MRKFHHFCHVEFYKVLNNIKGGRQKRNQNTMACTWDVQWTESAAAGWK